eukprot:Skav235242  [mRNA]  locus=scaffold3995:289975:300728:+ [translate_table: standard]
MSNAPAPKEKAKKSAKHGAKNVIRFNDDVMLLKVDEKDCFVLSFGCLVCWGCTPQEVGTAREYIQGHLVKPVESAQVEVDFLSISNAGVPIATKAMDRCAIAYSLAQSVRLSYWEQRIDQWVETTRTIPEDMANTGRVLLSPQRVSQMMGKLFALKNQVNLEFDTLDTPEFFWDYEETEPLYQETRLHLDMDRRIDIVNQRFEVLEDMFDVLQDKLNEGQEHRLTWIIIWLCALEAVFTAFKLFWIAGELEKVKKAIAAAGFIECNELEAVLKTLGVTLSSEQVRCVFKAADLNGDERLDIEEYEKLVRKAMPGTVK